VIKSDILKVDFKHLFKKETVLIKVVANLPYQISTPLLFRFVESKETFSALNLMLQKEVAERMVASPGRKEYGPLSIFIQTFADVSIQFIIRPSAFFPAPKVESALVHMVWKEKPMIETDEEEWFKRVVKACFGYRRKTLINALKHSELPLCESVESRIEEIGIDPRRRPETLTIQEFAKLAESLK
jgi:16S rRNA (adenine1518-N6/adenine1519-N6)-dimethyltransferase